MQERGALINSSHLDRPASQLAELNIKARH